VGGFYLLLAIYWFTGGQEFQGPVSLSQTLLLSMRVSDMILQNFDAIIGQPFQEKGSDVTEAVVGKIDSTAKV
jgi:hypothetical protein